MKTNQSFAQLHKLEWEPSIKARNCPSVSTAGEPPEAKEPRRHQENCVCLSREADF